MLRKRIAVFICAISLDNQRRVLSGILSEAEKQNIDISEHSTDILLLPECFITGYELPVEYEKSLPDDDKRKQFGAALFGAALFKRNI